MSELSGQFHPYDEAQCHRMLTRLPGVFAAGLRMDGGQIVEIHILASTDRNPKQITRDVQSALFAAYNLEIDHRIISIAQLPDDPFGAEASAAEEPRVDAPRLSFIGIDCSIKSGACRISVHLSHDGNVFSGEADCSDTAIQRNRAAAQATVNAVHRFLGAEYFNVLEVKQISVWGMAVMITVIESMNRDRADSGILIGSALQSDSIPVGVVRSALDALNRSIGRLYCAHSN